MFRSKSLFALACGLLLTPASQASLVTFDLRDPSPAGGASTAGELFEGGALSVVQSGVTLGISLSTTLGDGTASYVAVDANAGVDTNGLSGVSGDGPAEIEAGETVTFSVTTAGLLLTLNEIDFSGVGDSAADAALVTIGGDPELILTKALPEVDASSVWTPGVPIALGFGDTIAITASESLALQSITFATAAVPEPNAAWMLAVMGLARLSGRRRYGRRESLG